MKKRSPRGRPKGNPRAGAPVPVSPQSTPQTSTVTEAAAPVPARGNRKPIVLWLGSLLVAFCLYRIWNFQLVPLDQPGTLRAFLLPLWTTYKSWCGNNGDDLKYWKAACTILLALPCVLALLAYLGGPEGPKRFRVLRILGSRHLFFGSIVACLYACRFPEFFGVASNPDEENLLAAAQKMLRDPLFFRSVDSHTSGPLVPFPLTLSALFGFSPDYASARVTAAALVLLSLYFVFRAVRVMSNERTARIAILPGVMFFAIVYHPDYIHYNSETVPLLPIALAMFACACAIRKPESYTVPLSALGALVTIGFFSKLQCLPIQVAAAGVGVAAVYAHRGFGLGSLRQWTFWRPLAVFGAGLLPVPLLAAILMLSAGAAHDWRVAYLVSNWQYTRSASSVAADLKEFGGYLCSTAEFQLLVLSFLVAVGGSIYLLFRARARYRWLMLLEVALVGGAVAAGAVHYAPVGSSRVVDWRVPAVAYGTAAAAIILFVVRDWFKSHEMAWWGVLSGSVLFSAVFSIYASHQQFTHYLFLLVVPILATIGWFLARQTGRVQRFGLALPLVFVSAATAYYKSDTLKEIYLNVPAETTAGPEGKLIRKLTRPRGNIVVWGWHSGSYLSSARPMATRDTHMQRLFCCGDYIDSQYQQRFLRDLQRTPADLILDSLDVSCCYFNDRKLYGFELVPAIRSYIDSNYIRVAERFQQRFYLRRNLAALSPPRPCDADAVLCYQAGSTVAPELPTISMSDHARIETDFTPLEAVDAVTVFGTAPASSAGFQFQHVGQGKYRLQVLDGGRWTPSEEVALPEGLHVSLAIEFQGNSVTLSCNGAVRGQLRLQHPLDGSRTMLAMGTWKEKNFAAALDRLEVRSLRGAR